MAAGMTRFKDNPQVTGAPGIRFYTGVPLVTAEGYAVGSLCVIDTKPRVLSALELDALRLLAKQVMLEGEIERSRSTLSVLSSRIRAQEDKITSQNRLLHELGKMAELGAMAGGIAHEINNPLAIIMGRSQYLKTLLESAKLDHKAVGVAADAIDATCQRLLKIVIGLRSFVKDGSGASFERIPVEKIVLETLEFCRPRFYGAEIILEFKLCDPCVSVECRRIALSQVLLNLLNNAFDAVEDGGEKWVRVEAVDQQDKVEFSVTDGGLGIPETIQNEIMRPFFSTKKDGAGSGIGLSLSKRIIQEHDGQLFLDKDCSNTRFVFTIPKCRTKGTI